MLEGTLSRLTCVKLELKIAQAENCKAMPMLEALQNLGLAQQARIRCKASDQLI